MKEELPLLHDLNSSQKEAVKGIEGPCLIIAGAGSGKTRSLTHRIGYLLTEGVAPQEILALTFTNKAAEEMRRRVSTLVGINKGSFQNFTPTQIQKLFVGTFHALGTRILRREGKAINLNPSFTIYDEQDSRALVKELMMERGFSLEKIKPGAVRSIISRLKNELVLPSAFFERAQGPFESKVAEIYSQYEIALKKSAAVDFDDLLLLPVRLFESNPHMLQKYQEIFRYILVDEYQDTNHAQYRLLALLASAHRNLCVVGDDWQAIYGFRGADFKNMLRFEKDWPDARIFFLEENYRSTKNILSAAQAVIERNQFRTHKELFTQNPVGSKVRIIKGENEYDEARIVIEEILRRLSHTSDIALSDIAVLYRTNAQSRVFEECCVEQSIPYRVVGGVRFFDRKEVKDIVAYLRLIANKADALALRRISNVPSRGIGARTVEKIIKGEDSGEKGRAFLAMLERLRDYSLTHSAFYTIKEVLSCTSYEEFLRDGSENGESRWENIQELMRVSQKFEDLGPEGLPRLLEEAALLSSADEGIQGEERLTLMTLHAAKGLEFKIIFIVGCEEGLLPHERSMLSQSELEEERRLFYVGLTRAREHAYLSYVAFRSIFGSSGASLPSRFLGDIPEDLCEIHTSEELIIDLEV